MAWWDRHRTTGPPIQTAAAPPATVDVIDTPAAATKSFSLDPAVLETIREYGWSMGGTYAHMYRRQPAVRKCVDFLSRNIAQLNAKAYLRLKDADRQELDVHPLAALLRRPNPDTTRFRHMRDTVADIAINDVAYWRKIRENGTTVAVVRLARRQIVVDVTDNTVTYRTNDGRTIPRDDLVIFPGYNPDGDPWGVSPIETLRRVLAEEWASQEHRANYWKNATRQGGVIERPVDAPPWSDTALERFLTGWQTRYAGGTNAGRTPVLEDGMTYNSDGAFSPKDSEYIAGRQLTNDETASTYGIHPVLLGLKDTGPIEEAHRQHYQDTLGPWLRQLQDEIELQLLPDVDPVSARRGRVYLEFNLGEKLKASFEQEAKTLVTAVGVPYVTVNEARARQNLPKIAGEEFDAPIKPLNVMYGDQPTVTVPSADPSTAPTEQEGTPSVRSARAETKAVPSPAPRAVIARRDAVAETHRELFVAYFADLERTVRTQKAAFDKDRWDARLSGELYAASIPVSDDTGRRAAAQLDSEYDAARTRGWLFEVSRQSAENINEHTAALLADAQGADDVAAVFDDAKGARAEQLGLSRATSTINWARLEAGKQATERSGRLHTKTWIVTAGGRSRHPQLNGQTIALDGRFGNGAKYPGDKQAGPDETAGCRCLLRMQ